jgi:hypothetical protein
MKSQFWLRVFAIGICSVGSAIVVGGQCYKNTWSGPAINCVVPPMMGPAGPCPHYPNFQSAPISGCGFYSFSVAVPRGTSGNEPTGLLSQNSVNTVCQMTVNCTPTRVLVRAVPPVWAMGCAPGPAAPSGTASVFQATGGVCPVPVPATATGVLVPPVEELL